MSLAAILTTVFVAIVGAISVVAQALILRGQHVIHAKQDEVQAAVDGNLSRVTNTQDQSLREIRQLRLLVIALGGQELLTVTDPDDPSAPV